MKRSWHMATLIFILCLLWSVPGQAQTMKKLGQAGMTWLTIDPCARGAAMGSVMDWVQGDPNAAFYNPAGLAEIEGGAFSLNTTQWIADMTKYDAVVAYSLGIWGTFGISIQSMDYGDILGTVIANNDQGYEDTGMLDVGAYSVGLVYSKTLTERFTIGGVLKYTSQKLGSNLVDDEMKANEVTAASFDFGTIYDTGIKSFIITMSIRNFSGQLLYEGDEFTLPLTYKIGLSLDMVEFLPAISDLSSGWRIAVEGVDSRDRPNHINVGTEFGIMDLAFVRAGYSYREGGFSEEGGLSAGLGLKIGSGSMALQLDYAYSTFSSALGDVHRFSLVGYF